MAEFYKYIAANFRTPANARGKILVTFVIEKDGSISDINVLRDIGKGTGREVKRVLKQSPKWTPGYQDGKPVRVQYSLPLNIQG